MLNRAPPEKRPDKGARKVSKLCKNCLDTVDDFCRFFLDLNENLMKIVDACQTVSNLILIFLTWPFLAGSFCGALVTS